MSVVPISCAAAGNRFGPLCLGLVGPFKSICVAWQQDAAGAEPNGAVDHATIPMISHPTIVLCSVVIARWVCWVLSNLQYPRKKIKLERIKVNEQCQPVVLETWVGTPYLNVGWLGSWYRFYKSGKYTIPKVRFPIGADHSHESAILKRREARIDSDRSFRTLQYTQYISKVNFRTSLSLACQPQLGI